MKACSGVDEELFELNLKGKVCPGDEVKFLKNETVCGVECVYIFKRLPLHLLHFEHSIYSSYTNYYFSLCLENSSHHLLSFFLNFILFFNFTILYWFCHTSTWIHTSYLLNFFFFLIRSLLLSCFFIWTVMQTWMVAYILRHCNYLRIGQYLL